jgi:hypothetical protein
MPLFYLHIRHGTDVIRDPEGCEYPSLAAAELEAIRGARCLMSSDVKDGHLQMDQSIEVHDGLGQLLSSVPFQDALRITSVNLLTRSPEPDAAVS